jgi:hypothetical protein
MLYKMLLAKYTDKSFDELVNRKCAEHQQMKLHKRLGMSRFPVAGETVFPQVVRPAASGITGKQSASPTLLHFKERSNYSGGLPIGNLNDLQGVKISNLGLNHTIPLYKTPKATFILPKKNTVETTTEDLIFPVSRGTNTASFPEENRLALLKKETGTNPESEMEELEYFSEAELKRLRAKTRQTQTEENPVVENEANMYFEEAKKDFENIQNDISANGSNPQNLRLLEDAIKRAEQGERAYRERVAYESGLHFGKSEADDELTKLVKKMKKLENTQRAVQYQAEENIAEAKLMGMTQKAKYINTASFDNLFNNLQKELKSKDKRPPMALSTFLTKPKDEKLSILLGMLGELTDDADYQTLWYLAEDPEGFNENWVNLSPEPITEPSAVVEKETEADEEAVIDEVLDELLVDAEKIQEKLS